MWYVSLELGGTNLRYGVIDSSFNVVQFSQVGTELLARASDKILFLQKLVEPLIREYGKDRIGAVTMALSSLLDKQRSYVFSSPMVSGFRDLPIKSVLEKRLNMPVFLEKDVNILLLYEIHKRKLKTHGIITGFFFGTGLGNAISIDGEIYVGETGSAGELGHIPVAGLRERCGCGKAGCIELRASGRLLETLATEVYRCPIDAIFTLHRNAEEMQKIIQFYAVAVATEIGILDPSYVIVGGGVAHMADFPRAELIARIKAHLREPLPRGALNVLFSSGDPTAGVVGAALHASRQGAREPGI